MKKLIFLTFLLPAVSFADRLGSLNPNSTVLTSLSAGQMVYVSTNGNNSTGTAGRVDLPFLTPLAAQTAARYGQTIEVYPGTYTASGLGKDGVNWYLEEGSTISFTPTSVSGDQYIFGDGGSTMSYTVGGLGTIFISSTPTSAPTGLWASILLKSTQSVVSVHCKAVYDYVASVGIGAWYSAAIWGDNGTLYVDAETINAPFAQAFALYWTNGEFRVRAREISNTDGTGLGGALPCAIFSNIYTTATGDFYVNADKIYSPFGEGMDLSSVDPNSKVWINANLIDASDDAITNAGGKLYVNAQKIAGSNYSGTAESVIELSSGTVWISASKITGTYQRIVHMLGGLGTHFIQAEQFEDLGHLTGGVVASGGTGNLLITNASMNMTIQNAITAGSGSTVTVQNCSIATISSKKDIFQSGTGVLNVIGGSGSGKNGTYTVTGSPTYLSPFVLNSNSLQSGATFFVSSGAVSGQFNANIIYTSSLYMPTTSGIQVAIDSNGSNLYSPNGTLGFRADNTAATINGAAFGAQFRVDGSSAILTSPDSSQSLRVYNSGIYPVGNLLDANKNPGTSGQVATSNGSGSGWNWQNTLATLASSFTYTFNAAQANLPGVNAPYISNSTNSASAGVYFDEVSTQSCSWATVIKNYQGNALKADILFTSTATSGTVNWGVYSSSQTPNSTTSSYDAPTYSVIVTTSVTLSSNSNSLMRATVNLQSAACANGDVCIFKLEREAGSSDTAVGQAACRYLRIYE